VKILFFKLFIALHIFLILAGCKQDVQAESGPEASQLPIDNSLIPSDTIDAFIEPYRARLNAVLDTPLSYAPKALTKTEGQWNTPLGNLMADMMLERANAIAQLRGGEKADLALLNFGVMRSSISEGAVSQRTAYEVMPFENGLVVVGMQGKAIQKMVEFLIQSPSPHPISGIEIVLDARGNIRKVSVAGRPIVPEQVYLVATSDYLVQGGDHMDFFADRISLSNTGYKIRDAMLDYFKITDTLRAQTDNRFIQLDGL
jgi:2',3'-cyclic-nucleotide 2'-phosphodiesterase (5'-nucleotidase family)